MLTRTLAKEILVTLQMLPADKLAEVYDYISFLRERYTGASAVDTSDVWSDEDISDLVAASAIYAEQRAPSGAM